MNWFSGLIAGLFIGWVFLPTPLGVCGLYNSNAAPAWVQAVGSVLAIFVAAGIPWWQERIRRKEENKQLSIATLRLRSNLEVLGKAATDRAASYRLFDTETATPETIFWLLQSSNLFEAGNVTSHIEKVHHFEERIQKPILALLEELDQYNTEHGRLYDVEDSRKVEQMRISKSALINRLEIVANLSFKASTAIRLVDEENRYPDLRARNLGGRP